MALRVHGIINHEPLGTAPAAGVTTVVVRDLAAVVEDGEYSAAVSDELVDRHLEVVAAVFDHDAILPAPVGTVFRSQEVLERWMDIHYVALSDALAWVEERVAARLHISRPDDDAAARDATELAVVAGEVTRSLRHHAVSTVSIRNEATGETGLSSAYLVERQLWGEFVAAVREEQDRHTHIRLRVTGPWPPYDFVRVQFGA